MTDADTTLAALVDRLDHAKADQALIFTTDAGDIGAGYHVTELKQMTVNSIDCGGRRSAWDETQLQLLDGTEGKHMSVGKFVTIARRSMDAVARLGDAPLSVEYAPQNQGLHRYRIGSTSADADGLRLSLIADAAICKPQAAWAGLSGVAPASDTKEADQTARPASSCCSAA